MERLRVAYLCDLSPQAAWSYSGGNTRIFEALGRHLGDVDVLPQGWFLAEPVRRAIAALPERLSVRARWRAHYALAPLIAPRLNRVLRTGRYDVLVCAYALHALSGVKPPARTLTVFTADTTVMSFKRSSVGAAFGGGWLGRATDAAFVRAEARAIARADLVAWPSQWAASQARRVLGAGGEVIPWGANLDFVEVPASPPPIGAGRPLNLLFVGRDWAAKGGPLAVAVLDALVARGIDARLTVIGAVPPPADLRARVRVLGLLDRSRPDQNAAYNDELAASHFLLQPSVEAYGFAFCEASAHGLPSLARAEGGVPVIDGVNGFALPPGAPAQAYADQVMELVTDPERYAALRASTRQRYVEALNWDAWARALAERVREMRTARGLSDRSRRRR